MTFGHFMDLGSYTAARNTARYLTKGLCNLEAWLAAHTDDNGCCSKEDLQSAHRRLQALIDYWGPGTTEASAKAAAAAAAAVGDDVGGGVVGGDVCGGGGCDDDGGVDDGWYAGGYIGAAFWPSWTSTGPG